MEPAAAHAHRARPYERRRPETTALHQVVREHLATFLARHDDSPERNPFPTFVRREFQEDLTCGLLAAGFLRVHCPTCKQDALVAFSCKRRGFCPSCCARRMSDTAAHLVERVLPQAPVRQWVFKLPHPLRFRLAYDPKLLRAVRRVFTATVLAFYRRQLRTPQSPRTQSGAVVFVQRFGSALDLNVHFHALFLDGAYTAEDVVSPPRFRPLERLTDEHVAKLVSQLQRRVLRVIERHDAPDEDELTDLETCYAASIRKRRAFGPHAGTSIPCIRTHPSTPPDTPTPLCASLDGFTLHAAVRIPAREFHRREPAQRVAASSAFGRSPSFRPRQRLCRYVTRPPIATERLSILDDGQILYRLRRPFRDGTEAIVFDPLTFLEPAQRVAASAASGEAHPMPRQRLAALIPRPRVPLITYHGVLAPAAAWRDAIVPAPPEPPEPKNGDTPTDPTPREAPLPEGRRFSWPQLMERVFEIDVLRCPCGARRRVIAEITDPLVIRAILEHLDLPATLPDIAPARPPPQPPLPFEPD